MGTRQVRAATEDASDRLLDLELACFDRLDEAIARVARATREHVLIASRYPNPRLAILSADLLPDVLWLRGVLLPPVGDLLAATRERSLFLVRQQLGGAANSDAEEQAAARGLEAARLDASVIERDGYGYVVTKLDDARVLAEERLTEQRRLWSSRGEDTASLIARLCARDPVPLAGSRSRGAVWLLEAPLRGAARAASVEVANRLLAAGMAGWNAARG